MLRHPIEEYFRYHPPQTPERIALHKRANTLTLEVCRGLIQHIEENDRFGDRPRQLIQQLESEIPKLTKDPLCQEWARTAISNAISYVHESNPEGVMMTIQQARMFLNQGITLDSL